MSDLSDAPRFQVGDKVRLQPFPVRSHPRAQDGIIADFGPIGNKYAFLVFGGVRWVPEATLTLLQPALYLDDEDVKALERLRSFFRHDDPRVVYPEPGDAFNAAVEADVDKLEAIIARAKRAPAKTETNDG